MFVTVAICTFNRAESLHRPLDSLAAMRVARDLTGEVVIVNNNIRTHTDDSDSQTRAAAASRRRIFQPSDQLSIRRELDSTFDLIQPCDVAGA